MKNAVTIPMQSFGYHISGTAHAEFEHVVRLQRANEPKQGP
jgi:hypothetical protein